MKKLVRNSLRKLMAQFGRTDVPLAYLDELREQARVGAKAGDLGMVAPEHLHRALDLLGQSQSQHNQDFVALECSGWKRGGYFVEFGGADGKTLSNSWLLETAFGWDGIIAEPGRVWRERLIASGRQCKIEFDCVWSSTGETLQFCETPYSELSTLSAFRGSDKHDRSKASTYDVKTVSLQDLLDRHGAPAEIDYLSIDTEGSELDILASYDFSSRPIHCITVEHNHTAQRQEILTLLSAAGYTRKWEELSNYDDWYVLTR